MNIFLHISQQAGFTCRQIQKFTLTSSTSGTTKGVSHASVQGQVSEWRASVHHLSVAPKRKRLITSSSSSSPAAVPPPPHWLFVPGGFGQWHLHGGAVDLDAVHHCERGERLAAAAEVDEGVVGQLLDALHAAGLEARELPAEGLLRGVQHQVPHLQTNRTVSWRNPQNQQNPTPRSLRNSSRILLLNVRIHQIYIWDRNFLYFNHMERKNILVLTSCLEHKGAGSQSRFHIWSMVAGETTDILSPWWSVRTFTENLNCF